MRRRKTAVVAVAAGIGLAAVAMGQIMITPGNGGFRMQDSNYGNVMVVNQLWNHAIMLENEAVKQQKAITDLEKQVKEDKEKLAKLEKRVRNMELRGK